MLIAHVLLHFPASPLPVDLVAVGPTPRLDAFMRLLRNKIDLPGKPKLIHTVRGVGYMIRPDGPA